MIPGRMTRLRRRRLNKHTRLRQNRQGTGDRPWGKQGRSWPLGVERPYLEATEPPFVKLLIGNQMHALSQITLSKMETGGGAGILVGKITDSS